MKNRKTWIAIVAAAALVVAGVLVIRNRNGSSEEADELSQVFAAQRGSLVESITPTGEVSARNREVLIFDVSEAELIELLVRAGQKVSEGDVIASIDTADLERDLDQAEADLLAAEDSLERATQPYSALDEKQAQVAVSQALVSLEQAKEEVEEVQNPDVEATEKAVADATQNLQEAQETLVALQNDPSNDSLIEILQWKANQAEVDHGGFLQQTVITEEGMDKQLLAYNKMMDTRDALEAAQARAALNLLNGQNKVILAEQALAEAEEELTELRAGVDEMDLAQVQNKVAQAEYNLAKAQDDLTTIQAGPQQNNIELAQAKYSATVAALEEAQETLDGAVMVAPFDGTIMSTGADVGDLVDSGTPIATIADLNDLEITASVDETEISKLRVGQKASITFDAFPSIRLHGEIQEIPLEGSLIQNIVTYKVRVSLEGVEDVDIFPGMTANLTIVVGQNENALLVPALAIQQSDDGNVVILQDASGSTVVTPVQVGLSNGIYVEILRGLVDGDQVLVQYQTEETQLGFPGGGSIIRMPGMGGMGR
ncbi:MAG: efflux RND transporter periplasmic adaptor subunit [Anaerolineae bacterium]|nr:efflux RND transporter periplasmic adaptor subunit [Anaerolineae bacterium]